MAQLKRIHADDHSRLSKALALIVVVGACFQSAQAEGMEKESDGDFMEVLALVARLRAIGERIKRLGKSVARKFFRGGRC